MQRILQHISSIQNLIYKTCDRMSFYMDVENAKIYTVPRRE